MNCQPGVPAPNIEPYLGPVLDQGRSVEYRELGARDLLNRLNGSPLPFGWTVNPFRGCQLGCAYCYARYTHEFLGHADPAEFERTIYVKRIGDASLLASLRRARDSGLEVAIGTATDPYQPAELKFKVTKRVLEGALRVPGLRLGITTKSTLIARDLDLLTEVAQVSQLWVNFSIITLDADLARKLEPQAPRPDLRLRTMSRLARAGVATRLFVMPILPGLTDGDRTLGPLLEAAGEAGCREARWNVLFLRGGTREGFFKCVKEEFSWLVDRYRRLYARSAYVPQAYRDEVERRVMTHAHAVGLGSCAREEEAAESPGSQPPGRRMGYQPPRHGRRSGAPPDPDTPAARRPSARRARGSALRARGILPGSASGTVLASPAGGRGRSTAPRGTRRPSRLRRVPEGSCPHRSGRGGLA